MKSTLIAGALLAVLASHQEQVPETAADLDKRARETLQKKVVVLKNMTLPMFFYMLASNGDAAFECYADPVAIPKLDEVKTSVEGEAPLEEIIEKSLKAKGLVHFVWQGIVVLTDEKGRKAFQETDWTGLTRKATGGDFLKKLDTVSTFEWDAFKPQEALKEFAKQSGVPINPDALKGLEIKIEKRGMLSPDRTTLRGALVCLARTTGITYEIDKDGALIAKPPAKK
jgi:hypothetical protein